MDHADGSLFKSLSEHPSISNPYYVSRASRLYLLTLTSSFSIFSDYPEPR